MEDLTVHDLIYLVDRYIDNTLNAPDLQEHTKLAEFVQQWSNLRYNYLNQNQKKGSNMSTSALIKELVQDNTDAFTDAVEEQLRTAVQDYIDEHIEEFAKDKATDLAESIGDEVLNKLTEEYRD